MRNRSLSREEQQAQRRQHHGIIAEYDAERGRLCARRVGSRES